MNFSSPALVASVIQTLRDAEVRRAPNRALIDNLFNGAPPYTQQEAEENKIQWNVNWGEGSDLLLQGREQLENAHLSTEFRFTVRLPDAPQSKAQMYAQKITKKINKYINKSRPYFHSQRSKWGSVALHGTGSQIWTDSWSWKPCFVPVPDLLIPTDTELPLENLNHFAHRRRMSPGQLFRKTFGRPESQRDPGWNLDACRRVFEQYKDVNQNQNSWNWFEHPEQMAQLWKQNAMYYETDAVPSIWMWDFYFQEDDNPESCWYRKILLDSDCAPGRNASSAQNPIVYLYDSEKAHAKCIDEILHIQFIDGNNVPPFMYHSTRGLGQRLHDAVQALNRLRSQFVQKVFEDMMLMFRAQDPTDRSRLDKIYLGMNYAIIPDGLSFVTREQRYTPDPRLVEMQLASLKQLIGEGSSQYTQDIDTGTTKERTAFEVSALLSQTTKLTGSMLNLSYMQEEYSYREICRRFTKKDTLDWDCKRFQNECREDGVPEKWLNSERWEIEPVRVLGQGNLQLEQAQAQAMLQIRPMLNPQAQNEVLNDYVFAITRDPKRAERLAPLEGQPQVTDTTHDTEIVFGALMSGSMVTPKPGLVPIEVIVTMLRLIEATVNGIMQTGGVGTPQQLQGLQNALMYTQQFMQQLAQDRTMKEVVKMLGDQYGKLANLIKAMAQRQAEAAQRQNGNQMNAEAMAKIQSEQMLTKQKLQSKAMSDQLKAASTRQKQMLKQQEFAAEQERENMRTMAEISNKSLMASANAEIAAQKAARETTESE